MNARIFIGLLMGYAIGLACGLTGIPVPAPPVLTGALLVVAMTSGYILVDRLCSQERGKRHEHHCAGPMPHYDQASSDQKPGVSP